VIAAILAQTGDGTGTGSPLPTLPGIPATAVTTTAVPGTDPNAINTIVTPPIDWSAIMPLLVLFVGAVLLVTVSSLVRRRPKGFDTGWTILTALIAMACLVPQWARTHAWSDILGRTGLFGLEYMPPYPGPYSAVAGAIGIDGFTVFCSFVVCIAVILAALATDGYLRREGLDGPEFYVLLLISAMGGVLLASSNDLIALFMGLETMSIAVYVMAAMHLKRVQSQEAGLKYFVLGAFSSAFLLYGIAMVYGATGTTNLVGIKTVLSADISLNNSLLLLGYGFLLVGLGFKVSAVPFHSWSPDVYDGSPTPAVIYMAAGIKVAAFAGLTRVFVVAFGQYASDWQPIIYALAVLSLVVGAVIGVVQTNVKRMLAYSSIVHAGFLLMAVEAANPVGTSSMLFYLVVYVFMVAGAFGVAALVGRTGDSRHGLDDYRGLGRTNPAVAAVFTLFLLAQAGVPFTTGFLAKFFVIGAAVSAGSYYLAIVAVIASGIAAFIYLRIVVAMYMSEGGDGGSDTLVRPTDRIHVPFLASVGITVCAGVTIAFGLFPAQLTNITDQAQPALVQEPTPPHPEAGPGAAGPLMIDPATGQPVSVSSSPSATPATAAAPPTTATPPTATTPPTSSPTPATGQTGTTRSGQPTTTPVGEPDATGGGVPPNAEP